MTIKSRLLGTIGAASIALSAQAAVAGGHGEMTVAYFLE